MYTGHLHGAAVRTVELYIAQCCVDLEKEAGTVDIPHVVRTKNEKFGLVGVTQLDSLVSDVSLAYNYVKNQQIDEISRVGYWKFKAQTMFDSKQRQRHDIEVLRPA